MSESQGKIVRPKRLYVVEKNNSSAHAL